MIKGGDWLTVTERRFDFAQKRFRRRALCFHCWETFGTFREINLATANRFHGGIFKDGGGGAFIGAEERRAK